MPGPARKYLTDIDTPSTYKQSYIPDAYALGDLRALPDEPDDHDSDRYAMHRSGMPHRSGEVGDYGRHDGTHLTATEMAELQRSGRLEQMIREQMIRRIQRARAARAGVEPSFAEEEPYF